LELLTKAVIEERLEQLTSEMRGKLFNENALKQLDKRASHSAIMSSKIEAKMRKFQEKALQLQGKRRQPSTPKHKSSGRGFRPEIPPYNAAKFNSNLTTSPIGGGTAAQTLNDAGSHKEGIVEPPRLSFNKFGPANLSSSKLHKPEKTEASSSQVVSHERKVPIKIDVQVKKPSSKMLYGLSEPDNDLLAPIFLNKI